MAKLQVLTFDKRAGLDALGIEPTCSGCRTEIEAVGETILKGQAPIQTLFCFQDEVVICALCVLDLRVTAIGQAERALNSVREQRRHVEQDILRMTGQRPE